LLLAAGEARAESKSPLLTVAVSRVTKQDVAQGRSFVGTVVPNRVSTVGSAVAGRVAELLVTAGDRVEKGQVLVRLENFQAQLKVEAAKAELELRKAALAKLQNGSRPEEIEQARARYESCKAAYQYAASRLRRLMPLREQNTITADQLEEAQSLMQQALQASLEAEAAYSLVKQGPRAEEIQQAAASVSVQEEQVSLLEDLYRKYTITAPFDGYVVEEFTEVGQWLPQAGSVVTIVELDEVEVEVPVPAQYIAGLRLDMKTTVTFPAIEGRDFEGVFEGKVSAIVRLGDAMARSFPVKVRLENPPVGEGVLLNPGMLGRVVLPVGAAHLATLVPKDAVVPWQQGRSRVFVVDSREGALATVRGVPVDLGTTFNHRVAVIGALKPGERVIVRGNERLSDGQQVRIVEPLASE
jgi:RND family efflux transporter MFP subunit